MPLMSDPIVAQVVRSMKIDPANARIPENFWEYVEAEGSDSRAWYGVFEGGMGAGSPTFPEARAYIEEFVRKWHEQHPS